VEQLEQLPEFSISATKKGLRLEFPEDWLSQHPLTWQELEQQRSWFKRLNLQLDFS
jgi:exopolyphosphatase/guanosine-5'-triphosphate,3'-diphosphate pyrophosphatase